MSLAAAGCQLTVFQLGGDDLPGKKDAPVLVTNSAVVAPLMTITGNPRTAVKAKDNIDFSSGAVITGEATINQMGEALYAKFLSIASGELTKGETIQFGGRARTILFGPRVLILPHGAAPLCRYRGGQLLWAGAQALCQAGFRLN